MSRIYFIVTLLLCSFCASAQTTQEWRDSVKVLSALIEQNPKSLELRMRKAECNIALGQWQYALDEYTNVLEFYPTHLGALYFRGYVNAKMKRYNFARNDYEQVLRYSPEHLGAMTGLIYVEIDDNHLQNAFDHANHLVELYPDSACVYAVRAHVEESRGMVELAIDDYSMAIEKTAAAMPQGKFLNYNDDYVQYVIKRMQLYRKKGDSNSIVLADEDRQMLISRGVASRFLGR